MDITKSVALVTGGASGLGEATVRQIAALGGKVLILDLAEDQGNRLKSKFGDSVIFFKANVTDEESVEAAIDKTIEAFGSIEIVVNCAGIGLPKKVLGKQGPHGLAEFNHVIQVNLCGTFNLIRLAAAKMVANTPNQHGERGVIINTASVAAFDGQIGQASYSASKGGIVSMTLPIAREFAAHGIRVMTIAPGLFETPGFKGLTDDIIKALEAMVPFPPRLGFPEEYALLVRSIIENPMLNGETIRLDGAIRMQPK